MPATVLFIVIILVPCAQITTANPKCTLLEHLS